jgi:hypothetical protein
MAIGLKQFSGVLAIVAVISPLAASLSMLRATSMERHPEVEVLTPA